MASRKLKHKELYKNIILIVLMLLSIVLFFRFWFGGWIWSYNMDYSNKTFFGLFDKASKSEPVSAEDIVMPKRLIVTGGGKRRILEKGTDAFSSSYSRFLSIIGNIGSGSPKPSLVSESEFVAELKSKSILLDFGSVYGKELLAIAGQDLPITATQSILITPGDSVIQKIYVYFKDYTTGEIYKLIPEIPNTEINSLIDSLVSTSGVQNVPFAFELGFDKAKEQENSEIAHNILLDSYLTIGLNDESVPAVYAEIPAIFAEIADNPGVADQIVSLFGFSASTTRRYVEKDDVTTFVNKNGTMRFSKSGYIEYTAETEGLAVTDGNNNTALQVLGNIYSIVQNVMIDCGVGEPQLHIASDLYGISKQNFSSVINIDYLINGKPVTIISDGVSVHPISITLENGRIVSYKHYIYKFPSSGAQVNTSSMIRAVDLLYSNYDNSSAEINVSDMYKSYVYTVGGNMEILWCAKLKGTNEINIIRE